MRILAIASTLLLTSCTSTIYEGVYVRAGGAPNDFYMDRGQCEAQAMGVSRPYVFQDEGVLQACLRGKGWYATKVNFGRGNQMRFNSDSSRCMRAGGAMEARGPDWLACMEKRGWHPVEIGRGRAR